MSGRGTTAVLVAALTFGPLAGVATGWWAGAHYAQTGPEGPRGAEGPVGPPGPIGPMSADLSGTLVLTDDTLRICPGTTDRAVRFGPVYDDEGREMWVCRVN